MRTQTKYINPLALAAVLGAAACAEPEPTGPATALDAPAAEASLRAIDAVLGNAAWGSFRALGARFTTGRAVASLAAAPTTPAAALARAWEIGAATIATVPRIPAGIRGTTFVLDPGTLQYVPDPDRSGAPANGVRYILYAVNPVTGDPVPGAEIGYADLTDEGDALPDRVALHLEVVSGGITFLDYRVMAGGSESAGGLAVRGMTTDGETEVVFGVNASARRDGGTEVVDVQFEIGIPDRGFVARAEVRNASGAAGSAGEVAMQVHVGPDVVQLTARATAEAIDAGFAVNGRPFATVRGDPDDPEIRGADGHPLSREERRVLHQLTQLTGRVFEMFGALMQPVGAILG